MKNKKAFTLIELIAVIIILGLIVLIAIPGISEYVLSSRKTVHETNIKAMEEAAKAYMIDCMSNNEKSCEVPGSGKMAVVSLRELIDKGFTSNIKDPDSDGDCNLDSSYVNIKNVGTGTTVLEYEACLYCSVYESKEGTCVNHTETGAKPICGEVKGTSSVWTNENRTISVECKPGSDAPNDQCINSQMSRTFTNTAEKEMISIYTKSGKSEACEVSVKVDKEKPTCSLKIVSGELGSNGWYTGEVKVGFDTKQDVGGSGLLTYGIGNSLDNREYNKNLEYEVNNGITTVFGYVKDYAGNVGYCSKELKVDTTKPSISSIDLGYQIYPLKETYTTNNLTEDNGDFITTGNDPYMDFTSLSDYKMVSSILVYLVQPLERGLVGQVFYKTDGGVYSEQNSVTRTVAAGTSVIRFDIPKNTYKGIKIDLGNEAGLSYSVDRIEAIVGDPTGLITDKDIRIYVNGVDTVTGVSEYSLDNGVTWSQNNTILVSSNEPRKVLVKDGAGNISNVIDVSISGIHSTGLKCELEAVGTKAEGDWFTSNVVVQFKSATVEQEGVTITKKGLGSLTGGLTQSLTTDTSGKKYMGFVEDSTGALAACSIIVKRDTTPVCSLTVNNPSVFEASKTITVTSQYTRGGQISNVTYSWNGSSYSATNSKSVATTALQEVKVKEPLSGSISSCQIQLQSRTEYQKASCSSCSSCSAAGCASYYSCSYVCGTHYKSCPAASCGCGTYNSCSSCPCETYGASYMCTSSNLGGDWSCTKTKCGGGGTGESGTWYCTLYFCSKYQACSACGCAAYSSCPDSSCGVDYYDYCGTSCCGSYYSSCDQCGCSSWGTYDEWSTTVKTGDGKNTNVLTRTTYAQ